MHKVFEDHASDLVRESGGSPNRTLAAARGLALDITGKVRYTSLWGQGSLGVELSQRAHHLVARRLIGPFNPILYSPESGGGFLDFEVAEERASTLDKRVRQVVIFSVGSVWRSANELYAHAAAARLAGLSDEAIRALEKGEVAEGLTDTERLAQTYTLGLTSQYSVDATEYYKT